MRHDRIIVAVIPALNEERALGGVLARMPAWIDAVIVADNGSTDATTAIARELGACVVREDERGYGAACQAGIAVLSGRMRRDDVVVFLDADGSDDPGEMASVVDPVLVGAADLVVGARLGREGMPAHQRLGTRLIVALLRAGFARAVTDLGPYRAIRWNTLLELGMRDRGFAWTAEMQARAFRRDLRVCEVPVSWRPGDGVSTISGTLRGSLRAGRDLSLAVLHHAVAMRWERLTRRPLRTSDQKTLTPLRPPVGRSDVSVAGASNRQRKGAKRCHFPSRTRSQDSR